MIQAIAIGSAARPVVPHEVRHAHERGQTFAKAVAAVVIAIYILAVLGHAIVALLAARGPS